MDFEVRFDRAAVRYLKKLKDSNLKKKYQAAVEKIKKDPYIGTLKKGDLAGIYSYDIYYDRTNYELAYRIYEENERCIVVIMAGTRENFYEQLKRYL